MSHLLDRGIEAVEAEQYHLAIDLFTQLIEIEPEEAEAYTWRGLCRFLIHYHSPSADDLNGIREYVSAVNDCNQAIELGVTSDFSYHVRGILHGLFGNYSEAISDHTVAIALAHDSEARAASYCNRGQCFEALEDFYNSIADYTSALSLQSQDLDALWGRAQAYRAIGMNLEALDDLLELQSLDLEYDDELDSQIAELEAQPLHEYENDDDADSDEESEDLDDEDEEDDENDEEEENDEDEENENGYICEKNDCEENENSDDELDLEELLSDLDKLTGLPEVKAEVKSLINLVRVQQLRRERGFPTPALSLHLVFTGAPGTGKTTVARLVSKIYRTIGLLSRGHLVEVDRSGLVAGYIGHTALKVQKIVQKAQGGVLFIDEAHTLIEGSENDFGKEAIDTLLKAMEDYRDRFIVIVAGYPEQMKEFLQSNPGLQSRFNKRIFFQNYTVEEMIEILRGLCADYGCSLTESAKSVAGRIIAEMMQVDAAGFGNGRGVRNLFEQAISMQANRLSMLSYPTDYELCTFIDSDFLDTGSLQAV